MTSSYVSKTRFTAYGIGKSDSCLIRFFHPDGSQHYVEFASDGIEYRYIDVSGSDTLVKRVV